MNNKRIIAIFVIIIAAAIIFTYKYTAGYQYSAPNEVSKGPKKIERPVVKKPTTENISKIAKIYLIEYKGDEPILEPVEIDIPADGNSIENAIQALIEFDSTKDITNPLPEGTELIGVSISEDLAVINFNASVVDGFSGGVKDEQLLLESIVKTASQFGDIKRVKILADGNPVTTFGHLEIAEPIIVGEL